MIACDDVTGVVMLRMMGCRSDVRSRKNKDEALSCDEYRIMCMHTSDI